MIRYTNVLPAMADSSKHSFVEPMAEIHQALAQRFPEAEKPTLKFCRAYYERCLTEAQDGSLVAVYFPPAINYVMDLGYENLVIFKVHMHMKMVGDPTFPHWNEGQFYSTDKEEASSILFPFTVRDLFVGTKAPMTRDAFVPLARTAGVELDDVISETSFFCKAPAFREEEHAQRLRALPEIAYSERNSVVRIIDVVPGWTLDRIF